MELMRRRILENENMTTDQTDKNKKDRGNTCKFLLILVITAIVLGFFSIGPLRKLGQPPFPEKWVLDMLLVEDKAKAVRCYRNEAEQGDPGAQYLLGLCYYYGEGVTKNEAEGIKWIHQAAKQGYAEAIEALQEMENKQKMGQNVNEN
jgi:TPR repeat protein